MTGIMALILRRDVASHKLRYGKTIKGDISGAIAGLLCGVNVGYLTLASAGVGSVDLSDLSYVALYLLVWASVLRMSL